MQQEANSSHEPYPFVRLAPIGGDGKGVWCDTSGVYIGARIALVEQRSDDRSRRRFVVAPADRLNKVLRHGYGESVDVASLLPGLSRVAAALEKGDLALANIALVHLRIPPFVSLAHGALAAISDELLKASVDDPDHPGYPKGAEDGKGGQFRPKDAASAVAATTVAAEALGVAPLFGELGSAALAALEALAAGVSAGAAGAVAFLGVLFVPTNRSLITQGTLPGQPGISYQYDVGGGSLQLYRNGEAVYFGQAGADGIFRSDDGRPIGRVLDGTIMLDPDAVAAVAVPGKRPNDDSDVAAGAAIVAGAAGLAASRIRTGTAEREEPKACPDPGRDRPGGKSEDAINYQLQISELPRLPDGTPMAVELNGVMFDGCRVSDGHMLEAKGIGFDWAMDMSEDWRSGNWVAGRNFVAQAIEQALVAPDRIIEWHFAEPRVADYFREKFREAKLTNVVVIYTPYSGVPSP